VRRPSRRLLTGVTAVLILAGSGVGYLQWRSASELAGYKNTNVHLGAVSTASVDARCPVAGHARLICLADLLRASVSPQLRAQLQLPYSIADAKRWSNFPPVGYGDRVGPTLADFTPAQLGIVKAILREAAGIAKDEGYDELEQILNADDFLKANTSDNAGFSSGNYHIALLGTPAATGTWELYFGGHHVAVTNTYRDGRLLGATPSFRGVEPFKRFTMNGRVNAPMAQERDAFAAMLTGLTPGQLRQAKLDAIFTDIVVGPQKDDNFPAVREGVPVASLNRAQQQSVINAIGRYAMDVRPADAAQIMARYEAELARTYVAFSGTPTMNAENDYVRIDGPSIWIELSMQPGRSLPGIHPHSVWRDRRSDYGGNK
jgi:hypothetical protein